jgi:hypothetical protein
MPASEELVLAVYGVCLAHGFVSFIWWSSAVYALVALMLDDRSVCAVRSGANRF